MMVSTELILLSIITTIGTIAITIIGYFLRRTMDENSETHKLAVATKTELEVLKTDHSNKLEFITEKFDDLKEVMVTLTDKIEKLTDKIK